MPLSEEEKNMVIEDIRNFNKVYEEVFINNLIKNIYIFIYKMKRNLNYSWFDMIYFLT